MTSVFHSDGSTKSRLFWTFSSPTSRRATAHLETFQLTKPWLAFEGGSVQNSIVLNKPTKYGVKAFTTADSTHGYILNILLYTGRDTLASASSQYRDLPQPAQVVLHLVEPYLDQGRHAFTDRYYTSIPLAQALSDRSTAFTGTAMKNRVDPPDQIRSKSFKLKDDEVLGELH